MGKASCRDDCKDEVFAVLCVVYQAVMRGATSIAQLTTSLTREAIRETNERGQRDCEATNFTGEHLGDRRD